MKCTLGQQTIGKLLRAKFFVSHEGIWLNYSHQAGGLPLLENTGGKTVCAVKDFVFNQRIYWN